MFVSQSDELAPLLIAIAAGDRIAFRELYDRVGPKLFAIIRRINRNAAGAEEILQDVFLKVWSNAGRFSVESGSGMAWLAAISRNRAIDVIRQKPPQQTSFADNKPQPCDDIADPTDRETQMNDVDSLRHCLGDIEEPTRSCILLAYYEGFSRDELASRYGQPVNTIKSWLHRGLTNLKQCLESVA
jgi:RNA polymerase sigma factor (sigma-70 family)